MPTLPAASQKSDSIVIGMNAGNTFNDTSEGITTGGKWEDEEERRFFEDIQDLKDFVPSSVLGVEQQAESEEQEAKESETDKLAREKEEVRKLEEELENLINGRNKQRPTTDKVVEDEWVIRSQSNAS